MRSIQNALSVNRGKLRKKVVDGIELRTEDNRIDLDQDWAYRESMFEVCGYMGVRIIWLRSDKFRCYAETISIHVRPPTCIDSLTVIAHEAAHIGFRHANSNMARHRMEYETSRFEIQFLQYKGIDPHVKLLEQGPRYVARLLQMAISRKSIQRVDRDSWHFANPSLLPSWRREEMRGYTPQLHDLSRNNGFPEAMIDFGFHAEPSEAANELKRVNFANS